MTTTAELSAALYVYQLTRWPTSDDWRTLSQAANQRQLAKRTRQAIRRWASDEARWLRAGVTRIGQGQHSPPAIKTPYKRSYEQAAA